MEKFDINYPNLYNHSRPDLKERTKRRLTEMAECGMEVVGYGQFVYKGLCLAFILNMFGATQMKGLKIIWIGQKV